MWKFWDDWPSKPPNYIRPFCQPEVENFGVSTLGNEDVRGLYIPMNDARRVRRVKRVGNLNRKRQEQIGLQRKSGDAVLQDDAIQIFHGDKCLPLLLANVINRANIVVVQCRRGLGFTLKTGEG